MSIAEVEIEREDGKVSYIHFETERRELRDIVDEVNERIIEETEVEESAIIRQRQKNPVIKTDRTERIYFKWDDGRVRVNVTMAQQSVRDAIVGYFTGREAPDDDERVPWDEEEMADEARERIREKREERERETEERERKRSERESRQRVREDTNHRNGYQQEPRGGDDDVTRDHAEIEGEYTKFIPPYSKNDANYHQPGSGENPQFDCKDCVHYIEGGGCHMVQGEINPEGHCEDLYADVGLFARIRESEFEINLALWGEMFEDRFGRVSLQSIGDRVREAISRKL